MGMSSSINGYAAFARIQGPARLYLCMRAARLPRSQFAVLPLSNSVVQWLRVFREASSHHTPYKSQVHRWCDGTTAYGVILSLLAVAVRIDTVVCSMRAAYPVQYSSTQRSQ